MLCLDCSRSRCVKSTLSSFTLGHPMFFYTSLEIFRVVAVLVPPVYITHRRAYFSSPSLQLLLAGPPKTMRYSSISDRGHAMSQKAFYSPRGGRNHSSSSSSSISPSTFGPFSGLELASPFTSIAPLEHDPTNLTTSGQAPVQSGSKPPRLQWPEQRQLSVIDPSPQHISSSDSVWDQRYLSPNNGGVGSRAPLSPNTSYSPSPLCQPHSPSPLTFVSAYPSPLLQGQVQVPSHIQSPQPDEPPPLKKRRVASEPFSGTRTAPGSNRRFYNFNDRTRSTAVGSSGSMLITFPLENGSKMPNDSSASAPMSPSTGGSSLPPSTSQQSPPAGLLPDDFDHGPTELPPRPYSRTTEMTSPSDGGGANQASSRDGAGETNKPRRRKPNLPDDVMDYVSLILFSFWLFLVLDTSY